MDSLLRRAIERREREAAELRELEDQRPRCEICGCPLCAQRTCKRTGRTDTDKRCVECLDILEVHRPQLTPVLVQDDIFINENEVEGYVRRMTKMVNDDEDWALYQELTAKEEDRPEPASS